MAFSTLSFQNREQVLFVHFLLRIPQVVQALPEMVLELFHKFVRGLLDTQVLVSVDKLLLGTEDYTTDVREVVEDVFEEG